MYLQVIFGAKFMLLVEWDGNLFFIFNILRLPFPFLLVDDDCQCKCGCVISVCLILFDVLFINRKILRQENLKDYHSNLIYVKLWQHGNRWELPHMCACLVLSFDNLAFRLCFWDDVCCLVFLCLNFDVKYNWYII